MPIKFHEGSKTFHIYNKHLSYITCIMENGQMENLYYGKAIRDKEDFSYLHEGDHAFSDGCMRSGAGTSFHAVYQTGVSCLRNR